MKRYCIIVGNAASDTEFIKIERMCYINAANRGYVLGTALKSFKRKNHFKPKLTFLL